MRAHMASHVALAKQNRERANQKKADTDAKVAAVAHAEVRAAEAKAKAIAQAEEEAALLKAEASTGAELEVKKAHAAKVSEELAMITALLERKEREVTCLLALLAALIMQDVFILRRNPLYSWGRDCTAGRLILGFGGYARETKHQTVEPRNIWFTSQLLTPGALSHRASGLLCFSFAVCVPLPAPAPAN
jgi:hypothetical protein